MATGTRSRGLVPSTNRRWLSVRAVYEDFMPLIESKEDADAHTVYIHLPGFLKEQIRIVAESSRGLLRVRGERLISGNTWSRFQEEVLVPNNCNITETRAKFEGGVLRITMPKRITSITSQSSSPAGLSDEATTPERSPPPPPRPAPPPNPAPMRPVAPPRPDPAPLRPEALPQPRIQAAAPRPEALPQPKMAEPRWTPSIQTKPRDDAKVKPSPTPQPAPPLPDLSRFTPSIHPKPQEDERSRFEASQKPSLPQLPPPTAKFSPPGLLKALPQPDLAPMKDPIASERWSTESKISAPMKDLIASDRWRTESQFPAPMKDTITSERWRTESKIPAPMKDPIASERRMTESKIPAPMKDPIASERRRTESEIPSPGKAPLTTTDSTEKAAKRYESLTEDEKRRIGMRGMSLRGLEEDRQLLVNMGAAVMVLVAFGAWISYSFSSSANPNN